MHIPPPSGPGGTEPSKQHFLVSSPGLIETGHLCLGLAQHQHVFVSREREPYDTYEDPDVLRQYEKSGVRRDWPIFQGPDFYDRFSLGDLYAAFERCSPDARALGNVGAYSLSDLIRKAQAQGVLNRLLVANLIRHPISFVDDHVRHVIDAQTNNPRLFGRFESMIAQILERYPDIEHIFPADRLEGMAFAASCQSVANRVYEFQVQGIRHFPIEDLQKDVKKLQDFCELLTGFPYPFDKLEALVDTGFQNGPSPVEIVDAWEPWQRHLFHKLIPEVVLQAYSKFGYDLNLDHPVTNQTGYSSPPIFDTVASQVTPPADEVKEAFEAGNYVGCIRLGDRNRWETFASMAMIGQTDRAREGLAGFADADCKFYEAVSYWMDGEEKQAEAILETLETPQAKRLLALIRKPQIKVLAQLPYARTGSSDFLTCMSENSRFEIQNISFCKEDLNHRPYQNVMEHVDPNDPPDFFIAKNVEWHLIPPNIGDLPCPAFGCTADFDIHVQALRPWLLLFDTLIVNDDTERKDAASLVPGRVTTYPMAFGVEPDLPPIPEGERDLDVFQSGFILHPYHPDKVVPCRQMLKLPENKKVHFFDGFTNAPMYMELLGRSKSCYTFVRHGGAMPTRGLEALSMGCCVVTQKESTLAMYYGPEHGVFTYDLDRDDLTDTLIEISDHWPEYRDRAKKGAVAVRKDFALARVADRYFRFLSVLAACTEKKPSSKKDPELAQKRMILVRGWLSGNPDLMHKIGIETSARLEKALRIMPSAKLYNDLARELILDYGGVLAYIQNFGEDCPQPSDKLTGVALNTSIKGINEFPHHLVLRFNLIRSIFHYGDPKMVASGIGFARETLQIPPEEWRVDPMDDVYPWDYFSGFFNYRQYFDIVNRSFSDSGNHEPELVRLILASIHYYMNFYSDPVENTSKAVKLDPDFPVYQYRLAHLLVERAIASRKRNGMVAALDNARAAEEILRRLGETTVLFPEAGLMLQQLENEGLLGSPIPAELNLAVKRYKAGIQEVIDSQIPLRMADWRMIHQPQPAPKEANPASFQNPASQSPQPIVDFTNPS